MAYRIKVTIDGVDPPVWRRLRVPGSLTFAELHKVIQVAFGWLEYHLYRFEADGVVVVDEDPDYTTAELWGERVDRADPEDTAISLLFENHSKCLYEYDFGDSWQHGIIVERRLKETKRNSVPVCLAGARHRPPEDVGGVSGYADFLETIRDSDNPERGDMLRWAKKDTGGRLFNPEYFDIEEVNERLSYALDDTPESAHALFTGGEGLRGLVKIGWIQPVVLAGGKEYPWERLGTLLTMLGDDLSITVKVAQLRR
jgi:hypothetical protein